MQYDIYLMYGGRVTVTRHEIRDLRDWFGKRRN